MNLENVSSIDLSSYTIDYYSKKLKEKFPNINWLSFDNSQLANFSVLSEFKDLEVLSMSNNCLETLDLAKFTDTKKLKILNLSKNKLTQECFGQELISIQEIETLDISHNNITEFPDIIKYLQGLLILNIANNKMKTYNIESLEYFEKLLHLDMSHNELDKIYFPGNLSTLLYLDISYNKGVKFSPRSFPDFANLRVLNIAGLGLISHERFSLILDNTPNLTELNISYNKFKAVPSSICKMITLERLNMSNNEIEELTGDIGQLVNLQMLSLSENNLQSLPNEFGNLKKLKWIYLNANVLTEQTMPDCFLGFNELEVFMCSFNQLQTIPFSLCKCPNLKSLVLSFNNLCTLPEEIYNLKNLENLKTEGNCNLVIPPKPVVVKDEFDGIDFSYENVKNMVFTMLKQRIYLENEEKKRLLELKKKNEILAGHTNELNLKKIMEVESKKVSDVHTSSEVHQSPEDVPAPPPRAPPKFHPQESSVDVSSLFPVHIKEQIGMHKFTIENLHPVLNCKESDVELFYDGDCYIFLKNAKSNSNTVESTIFFWIGNKAPMEKNACVAIHAVNLRCFVNSPNTIIREEQGTESQEFKNLFINGVRVTEGAGTATSLTTYVKKVPPVRLYKMFVKSDLGVSLERVPILRTVLNSKHIFIMDTSSKIYVWAGSETKSVTSNKARLFVEKLLTNDKRPGTIIQYVFEGKEPDDFFLCFIHCKPSYEGYQYNEAHFDKRCVLIEIKFGKGCIELPQINVAFKRYSNNVLGSGQAFILDCGMDVFLWYGSKFKQENREYAVAIANTFCEIIKRVPTTELHVIKERSEPLIYKSKFQFWDDILNTNYTKSAEVVSRANEALKNNEAVNIQSGTSEELKLLTHKDFNLPKIDIDPLFIPKVKPINDDYWMDYIEDMQERLMKMDSYVLENKAFNLMSNKELGHFYSQNCYVFLCKFREYESGDEDEMVEVQPSYTVFFWEGADCSKTGWLQFSFGLQKKFQAAIKGDLVVERIKQQQELDKFCAIFYQKMIFHNGERPIPSQDASQSDLLQLYQVRSMFEIISCRCVHIEADVEYFSSEFCYILLSRKQGTGMIYLWKGDKALKIDKDNAVVYADRLSNEFNLSVLAFDEGDELNSFWELLGGKREYTKTAMMRSHARLLRCTNDQGFYCIREKCTDFCYADLMFDDVMLLDSGTELFMWIGESASNLELKFTEKLIPVYLAHLAKDKNYIERKVLRVQMNKEPALFKRVFHGFR